MCLKKIREFVNVHLLRNVKYSSKSYIAFLKKKGVIIGDNVFFNQLEGVTVDVSRPSLVSFGSNIRITKGFTLLTHDYSWFVLRNKFKEVVPCSGPVKLGNNIFCGFNVTIMPNVEIGDNCIVGTGAVVTKNIPANSVVAGVPAKVVCTLDEFYEKRKEYSLSEAIFYTKTLLNDSTKKITINDFKEEFVFFTDKENFRDVPEIILNKQLDDKLDYFLETHEKQFDGMDEFLKYAERN